jgi:hypothetical protein
VAVLRAVEGCKGVADAALPAAACAAASKWQKLAIVSKNEMPSLYTTKQLHKCYGVDVNLYPAPTGTAETTKQFATT